MRLTTKSRYGTRLILDLAVYGKDRPVPLSDVSSRQNISVKYLEQITRKLKKAGIVDSCRGPSGGHMLAKSPEEISIGQIVRILEESTVIADCADQKKKICGVCNRAGECLSRWVWVEAGRAMFDCLDRITISSLLSIDGRKFKKK
ncbi:MAG: Rrf2 family transcriptional regulator [Desulfobacula sp.]|nr:Rrf2 family transcriptional regulator [Desulfobacula sp.]MDA8135129.1 Rrf2 family transcriptional regulator [Desulfobacteraceae bacterium]